ncbi:MAG: lysophospholipase, partial [archaeon]|nr:lysophospholipase [archaeon]
MIENASEVPWNLDYTGEDFDLQIPNYVLKGQKFKPENKEIKFVYIFVHGLTATLTFKKDFYPFINNQGGIVYACDHVGHGRSPGKPISCEIREARDEIEGLINLAKKEYPNLPIFLHGHSMGGLSVITYALVNSQNITEKINGLIAEAPWISECPQKKINFFQRAGLNTVWYLFNTMQISTGVGLNDEREDPKWSETYANAPYTRGFVTPRLMCSVYSEIDYVHKNLKNFNPKLPFLFMQGQKDALVDPVTNTKWINDLMKEFPSSDITFKSY